jgi:hypothetical protein
MRGCGGYAAAFNTGAGDAGSAGNLFGFMTVRQFYEQLLDAIAVDRKTWDAARDKRDGLAAACTEAIRQQMSGTSKFFPVGALAQGTQLAPLNDVDLVVTLPYIDPAWDDNPQQALNDVAEWIWARLKNRDDIHIHNIEISPHAIKVAFADEDFTADIVVAEEQDEGLLIPHCPHDEPASTWVWTETDPICHRDLVKRRNVKLGPPPIFSRQVRILKWWNRQARMRDEEERKPVSSFHMTALALEIFKTKFTHAEVTHVFFQRAAELVQRPFPDPGRVGEDLEARDPAYAAGLFYDAAEKTGRALTLSDDDAVELLREVFGDPGEQQALLEGGLRSVGPAGTLISGLSGSRSVKPARSYGDGP